MTTVHIPTIFQSRIHVRLSLALVRMRSHKYFRVHEPEVNIGRYSLGIEPSTHILAARSTIRKLTMCGKCANFMGFTVVETYDSAFLPWIDRNNGS